MVGLLYSSVFAESIPTDKVFKVVQYSNDYSTTDSFWELGFWSAVSLGDGKFITNAHVVLNDYEEIWWYYALCETQDVFKEPHCLYTAHVTHIDTELDLATLQIDQNISLDSVSFALEDVSLEDTVKVIGYPGNGGESMTLTNGIIAGKDGDWLKVDANLDWGNSWWGVFNQNNQFIWIPVSVNFGYTALGYVISLDMITSYLANEEETAVEKSEISSGFAEYVEQSYMIDTLGIIENDVMSFDYSNQQWELLDLSEDPESGLYSYEFVDEYDDLWLDIYNIWVGWVGDVDSFYDWWINGLTDLYEIVKDKQDVTIGDSQRDLIFMQNTSYEEKVLVFSTTFDDVIHSFMISSYEEWYDWLVKWFESFIKNYTLGNLEEWIINEADLMVIDELTLPDDVLTTWVYMDYGLKEYRLVSDDHDIRGSIKYEWLTNEELVYWYEEEDVLGLLLDDTTIFYEDDNIIEQGIYMTDHNLPLVYVEVEFDSTNTETEESFYQAYLLQESSIDERDYMLYDIYFFTEGQDYSDQVINFLNNIEVNTGSYDMNTSYKDLSDI